MPEDKLIEEEEHDMELISCISEMVRKRLKVVEILERRNRGKRRSIESDGMTQKVL